jgi:hypothetical protein
MQQQPVRVALLCEYARKPVDPIPPMMPFISWTITRAHAAAVDWLLAAPSCLHPPAVDIAA